jgi:4-diphosphocytidyl-2-C-methyl-D-erythritol kinase
MQVTVRALAKINLHLAVHARRPDGYHDLTTVFQAIALCDRVTVGPNDGPFALVGGNAEARPDSTNLVWRAADLLANELGRGLAGVRIVLDKAVPTQSGLGGGSADAMATLRALRAFWGVTVADDVIERLGARLGADVAFFARGGTALGTGRGDQLSWLPDFPDHHVAIVRPPFGVPTAAAYGWLAAERAAGVPAMGQAAWPRDSDEWWSRLPSLANDFEPVVARRHPEIQDAVRQLDAAGATLAAMSGSGSAVVALFESEAAARAAIQPFGLRAGWHVWLSRTVGLATYREAVAPEMG